MWDRTILFYINSIHDGGAERVILQLAHHFANAGYRSVLVTSFVDENEYPVPNNVVRITMEQRETQQSRVKRNITRIVALRKIITAEKPQAIISFMAEPNFRTILATRGLPVKVITSVRNDPNREYAGRLGKFVGKCLIPKSDGCVFQTKEAQQWFPADFQKRSAVILNDVDRVFFETKWVGGKDIVSLGRLSKQKNQAMLIRAFSSVAKTFPDTNLLIYGIGPLKDDLQNEIDRLGMRDRIKLMGLTADAASVYANAKMFVLSSDHEGMPNALLEALAMGVPSISTDCPCGGPRTVIKHGENGFLVPVGDPKEMGLAIQKLLEDAEYAKALGKKARESAQAYQTDRVFAQWKNYVERVIGGDRAM